MAIIHENIRKQIGVVIRQSVLALERDESPVSTQRRDAGVRYNQINGPMAEVAKVKVGPVQKHGHAAIGTERRLAGPTQTAGVGRNAEKRQAAAGRVPKKQ